MKQSNLTSAAKAAPRAPAEYYLYLAQAARYPFNFPAVFDPSNRAELKNRTLHCAQGDRHAGGPQQTGFEPPSLFATRVLARRDLDDPPPPRGRRRGRGRDKRSARDGTWRLQGNPDVPENEGATQKSCVSLRQSFLSPLPTRSSLEKSRSSFGLIKDLTPCNFLKLKLRRGAWGLKAAAFCKLLVKRTFNC